MRPTASASIDCRRELLFGTALLDRRVGFVLTGDGPPIRSCESSGLVALTALPADSQAYRIRKTWKKTFRLLYHYRSL
jgi:hypothetical protein